MGIKDLRQGLAHPTQESCLGCWRAKNPGLTHLRQTYD